MHLGTKPPRTDDIMQNWCFLVLKEAHLSWHVHHERTRADRLQNVVMLQIPSRNAHEMILQIQVAIDDIFQVYGMSS